MWMRRILAALVCGTLLLSGFSGCTNSDSTTSSGQTQQVEIEFGYNSERATNQEPTTEVVFQATDDFGAAQERVRVKAVFQSDRDRYYSPEKGRSNDLVWRVSREPLEPELDAYLPLDEYLSAEGWRSSFYNGLLDLCKYDGNINKIPVTTSVSCMFYNKELLAQAGIAPETIITWDDFLAACETLKRAGIQPISLTKRDSWRVGMITNYLVQRIGGFAAVTTIAEGRTGATFEQNCFVRAAEMTLELFQRDYALSAGPSGSSDPDTALFYSGEAAFYFMGSWAVPSFYREGSLVKDKAGVLPFPEVPGGKGSRGDWMCQVDGISVYKDSKHTEESVSFLRWMTSEGVQTAIGQSGVLPATNVELDVSNTRAELVAVHTALRRDGGTVFPFFDTAFGSELSTEYYNALNAVMAGVKTPEQAFADLQSFYTENGRGQ